MFALMGVKLVGTIWFSGSQRNYGSGMHRGGITGANRAGLQKSARADRFSGAKVVYAEKTQAVPS